MVLFHLFGISGVITAGGESPHEWALWTIFGNTLDIFFILSGFVLFLPVLRRGGEVGPKFDFYVKRFVRLQPEYWVCLFVLVGMIYFIDVPVQPDMPTVGNFLMHFFDLQSIGRMLGTLNTGFGLDGALWIMPVIAGLYLAFPFIARFYHRFIWAGLAIAAAVTVFWKNAPGMFPDFFQEISGNKFSDEAVRIIALDQSPAFFFSFALGMTVAWVYWRAIHNPDSVWIKRGVIAAFLIGIPAYVLVSIPFTHEALASTTGFDGSSRGRGLALNSLASSTVRGMLILGILLGPLWLQRPFASRPARWVAEQSFGIYLIHLPIAYYALQLLDMPQDGNLRSLLSWMVVVLPIAAAYAWCSRRLVGQPAIRATDRWMARRRARSTDL